MGYCLELVLFTNLVFLVWRYPYTLVVTFDIVKSFVDHRMYATMIMIIASSVRIFLFIFPRFDIWEVPCLDTWVSS